MDRPAKQGGETSAAKALTRSKDLKIQAAKVHLLDGTSKDYELCRGSEGGVLFALVSAELSIEERQYFSLCFYDKLRSKLWIYNDKKIVKQLKELVWTFSFEVKFYPTSPATLNDGNARHYLFLQLRKDIRTGRLPASIATHALLGAYIAQVEYGDADSSREYEDYLENSLEHPNLKDQAHLAQVRERIKELHLLQKGLTSSEAVQLYLDACRQLNMYGVFLFEAKDSDKNRIRIGICATGVNIYKDTIRVHRFPWRSVVKIGYKKKTFSLKLCAGELVSKDGSLRYKLQDYSYAKRVWKCGVEHHAFFHRTQSEVQSNVRFFHFGSGRLRQQGRTLFQTTKVAPHDKSTRIASGTVPRTACIRFEQTCDDLYTTPEASYETRSCKRSNSSACKEDAEESYYDVSSYCKPDTTAFVTCLEEFCNREPFLSKYVPGIPMLSVSSIRLEKLSNLNSSLQFLNIQ